MDHQASWRLQASCRFETAEIFFAVDQERGSHRFKREQAAKAICASCPVATDCRDYALSRNETYGVWGGLTESDRRVYAAIEAEIRARSMELFSKIEASASDPAKRRFDCV